MLKTIALAPIAVETLLSQSRNIGIDSVDCNESREIAPKKKEVTPLYIGIASFFITGNAQMIFMFLVAVL
ncbi:hypothetical protein SAMN05443667_1321 [Flavobacterium gillisiae]|uniref:Uncharacterized protein n=1 Tax=Flavobacterium gillisiae TaxID=150146 RepID=A0A1H4GDV8_9FLAO|nr:hypothetical protein SAMN05443667_1321 [Flavobacterium gillisiae]